MSVADVVKEMDLILPSEQGCSDRVDRRITPPLVIEAACFVQVFEEFHIRLRPPEVQIT